LLPTIIAFTTAQPVFLADVGSYARKDNELWTAHGRPESMLFEPIMQGDVVAGVLVMGWTERIDGGRRPAVVNLLVKEAALAIQQADRVQELTDLASIDSLTGVLNRRAWDHQLDRAFADPAKQPVCIALLDLDKFKAFNDTHGHQAGDRILKEAAAAWRAMLRPDDVLARYGGEEFAILLPSCDLDRASAVLERMRDATPGRETCSAGIAEWDGHETAHSLVGRADRALYAAKTAGRDRAIAA
jgi:diguanylate cyclase (GGDEF)-like protein